MPNIKRLYPSDEAEKYIVRFPAGMRDQLKDAAKAANRTLNAEIVARLQASFKQEEAEAPPYAVPAGVNPELDRQIAAMHKRIASIADALEGAGLLPKPGKSDAKQT